MSCDRRCFDKESKWHGHEDCNTCPGADVFKPKTKQEQVPDTRAVADEPAE
jgi:hypothetical protein